MVRILVSILIVLVFAVLGGTVVANLSILILKNEEGAYFFFLVGTLAAAACATVWLVRRHSARGKTMS
jgi:hypothetical protein